MATKQTNTKGKKRMTKKERARKKRNRILLIAAEILVLCVMGLVLYLVTKTDKMEGTEIKEEDIIINEEVVNGTEGSASAQGYRVIALFGVDARNGALGKGTRTDTIMLACINENTKEVKLVSVYRDTYLNLGNDSYGKANAAYAKGGPKQAISMLNMNMDLQITDYVTVGFAGLVDTIDELGGVQIEVDDAEITHLNNYQIGTSEALGRSYTKLTSTGLQTLDGMQATSYCRIRYTAGDDFKRAERQREVIQAIADKAKEADITTLNNIANKTFSQVATSLELSEILGLLGDINEYKIIASDGFPFEQYRTTGNVGKASCVIPTDLETNVKELHKFLFGTENYEPSSSVKEYSQRVSQDTGR